MQVEYTVADYFVPFFVCVIGSALLVGALCVFASRKVMMKFQRVGLFFVPVIGFAIFLFGVIGPYAVPILEQTGDLLVPGEYVIKTTAGQIRSITPAEDVPIYYIDGKVCGADILSVDDERYYVISEDLLAEGMLVEIRYAASENNVILGWQEVDAQRVEQVQSENTQEHPPVNEPVRQSRSFAPILITVGFLGIVCISILSSVAGQRIKTYLLQRDLTVHGKIVPKHQIIYIAGLPILFFGMIIVGLSADNTAGLCIMFLLSGGMYILSMTEKFTSMTVDGNCLYLRRLGKEKKYMVEDIHSVEFRPCRGFVGTSFVIVFNDGKTYWFDRDCHCGVQNVYNELIKRMK